MSYKASGIVRLPALVLTIGLATVASAATYQARTVPVMATCPMTNHIHAAAHRTHAVVTAQRAAEARERAALDVEIDALRPGSYLWRPERKRSGPVEIVVSIERQMAFVYRAGALIGATTVSTGRRGHPTPTGSFMILQKARRYFSNIYRGAPMPNMQRLTWDGIALHAGTIPGYPASHGCVRLPMEFSRLLFGATSISGTVHIVGDAPRSATAALEEVNAAALG